LFRILAARHRKRGGKFLAEQQWELAAAEFKQAISRHPGCVESLQGLGIALLKQQSWREAESALAEAVQQHSDPPGSLHGQLGMARVQLAQWPESLTPLTRAAEAEPENAEYHELRGRVLLELEEFSAALAAFTRATRRAERDFGTPPWWERGQFAPSRGPDISNAFEGLAQ